jgi:MarR-like DNA-binding transcriptional regulator SgrR of sgrS sRNA
MTAEDVVYTFERLIRSSRRTLYSFIYKPIKSVRALTPTTVRFELEEPNELFLPFLCTSRAAIVPKDLGQMGTGRFGSMPMGTGPFKVTEMSESVCVLEVFAPYFQGRAHLDRVEIVHVPWETENSHGEVLSPFHVIHSPSAAEVNWSQIHSGTTIRKFVTCNTKRAGPLNDPTVRAHVLDCLRGSDTNQPAVVPPNKSDRVLQIATIPQYRQDAENIAKSLEHSGYACKVVSPSPEEFKGDIRLESDLIVFSLIRDQDEQLRLFDLYLTIAEHVDAHNRIDIGNILAAAVKEPDARVRAAHLRHVEESLIRDHHLCILSERPLPTAYLPSVRGVTFNSQGWVNLRTIWFPPVLE